MARSPLLQARKGHLGRGNEHEQQARQGQQKEEDASLSIQIRRAGVQKKFGGRAGRLFR